MIKHLFIDNRVRHHPETDRLRQRLRMPAQVIDDPGDLFRWINRAGDPVLRGKQTLYLTNNRSRFLKACPGTRDYHCCGYQILHCASYCTLDCAYCILQSYFHPPLLQFFVNREALATELDSLFAGRNLARVGTGEFTDSLIWEPWTDLTDYLVKRFAGQHRAVLELKTKTANIARLQSLDHRGKTIIAWSLNTPRIIKHAERRTASLDERLAAAARCQRWGYPLAFHFDPMMLYDDCEIEYRQVVDQLFRHVAPDRIVWISLGTFRFMPALKPIIARRFPRSTIAYGEFITGLDNKMRYFKPLRIALYRKMVDWIREAAPGVTLYFCMEDDEVWAHSMGAAPAADGGVGRMLDESARRICGLTS